MSFPPACLYSMEYCLCVYKMYSMLHKLTVSMANCWFDKIFNLSLYKGLAIHFMHGLCMSFIVSLARSILWLLMLFTSYVDTCYEHFEIRIYFLQIFLKKAMLRATASLCSRQRPPALPSSSLHLCSPLKKFVGSRFTISSPRLQNNWVKIHRRKKWDRSRFTKVKLLLRPRFTSLPNKIGLIFS